MKTQKQIQDEIVKLEQLFGKLKPSFFGDNNNLAVSAQIDILLGNLSAEDIAEMEDDGDAYTADACRTAQDWLNGDYDGESLADEWEGCIA